VSEIVQKAIITASTWIVIAVLSFGCGALYVSKRHAKADADNNLKLVEKQKTQSEAADKIVTQYVDRIVTKEVRVYVPSKDNTCRVLDGNFRLFYDSAITGLPYTAGDPNAAPSSIDSVAASIAANFDSCAKNSDQLKSLQDWAITVSKP